MIQLGEKPIIVVSVHLFDLLRSSDSANKTFFSSRSIDSTCNERTTARAEAEVSLKSK